MSYPRKPKTAGSLKKAKAGHWSNSELPHVRSLSKAGYNLRWGNTPEKQSEAGRALRAQQDRLTVSGGYHQARSNTGVNHAKPAPSESSDDTSGFYVRDTRKKNVYDGMTQREARYYRLSNAREQAAMRLAMKNGITMKHIMANEFSWGGDLKDKLHSTDRYKRKYANIGV